MESKVIKELKGVSGATATITETKYETKTDYAVIAKFNQWTDVHHAETLAYAESLAEASIENLENLMPKAK